MKFYLDHMISILDIHALFKKINKYKLRFIINSWITPALQKFTSVKNSLLKKFINCNDSQRKTYILDIKTIEIFYQPFWKEVKNYYNHYYFVINWNSIENTWKGIKSILSVKLNPSDIPKIFNNCFSSIASQTRVNIKYSHKHFLDFLKNRAQNYFLSPTEIALICLHLILLNQLGLTAYFLPTYWCF